MDEIRPVLRHRFWGFLGAAGLFAVAVAGAAGAVLGGWRWSAGAGIGCATAVLDVTFLSAGAFYWFASARGKRARWRLALTLVGKAAALPLLVWGVLAWARCPVYPMVLGLAFGATAAAAWVVTYLGVRYSQGVYVL